MVKKCVFDLIFFCYRIEDREDINGFNKFIQNYYDPKKRGKKQKDKLLFQGSCQFGKRKTGGSGGS